MQFKRFAINRLLIFNESAPFQGVKYFDKATELFASRFSIELISWR